MAERMSGARRLAYSLGMPGYGITDRLVVAVALYYYLPPSGRGLVPQVSPEIFLGSLTVFGLAMLAGRVFDSLADPLVGYASDRSRSRLGRRRSFLIYGIVPMVVCPGLLFWPPGAPGSAINGVALAALLVLYFVAFTVYVAPYLALLPELTPQGPERVRLSRLMAMVSFPVLGLYGTAWPYGIEIGRALGVAPEVALRTVVGVSLGLAFVLCLLPILAVDERRFTETVSSELPFKQAVGQTLSNRPFRIYLGSQLLLVLGVNMITPAPVYYATVIVGRSEGFAGTLGLGLFGAGLVGLLGIGRLSDRIGAKRAMILCSGVLALALGSLGFLAPDAPGGPHDARNLRILWSAMLGAGLSLSGLLVLPYVLISQVIDLDRARTGASRSAMYFGVQGLLIKWMYGVASAVLAFLLMRFGSSPDQPLGVLLIGPLAALPCLASALLLARYPEREVLAAAWRPQMRGDSPPS